MSDFPRGWTLSVATVNPGASSITVPAIAGVVHVLDGFSVKSTGTAAGAQTVTLSSSDGVFAGMILAILSQQANGADEASGSGLDLAAGPGASLTVTAGTTVAGNEVLLLIQGHDI